MLSIAGILLICFSLVLGGFSLSLGHELNIVIDMLGKLVLVGGIALYAYGRSKK